MRRVPAILVRFALVWVLEALSLLAMSAIIPGISLQGSDPADLLAVAMSAALVLAVMNGLVRPVLILLTLPLNVRTLGALTLLINSAMLLLTAYFLPYFEVSGWAAVLLGPLVLMVLNTLLSSITTIEDDYSFFDGVVQWLSRRQAFAGAAQPGRGLVLLEIDGLSYPSLQRALDRGLMPTVGRLMRDGTHVLSTYDCGVPSQTSSCQAGIMYGDNFDIPAFRWYEKDRDRLMVSNHFGDAAEMNARYAHGHGLLRQGSSTNNLMAGDAAKVLLTMSVLRDNTEDEKRRRDQDLYLFWLNPYIMPRSIILSLWDVAVELYEGLRQRVRNVQPRINRLEKGYPFLRAITNVFLRNVSTYVVILDVIRGAPAIYTTYVGYDEVAHHAGPDTSDALNTLKALDAQFGRILDVVQRKAPRPYDVFILSDHGQSVGATFRQRYGQTLTEFITGQVRDRATVTEVNATENSQGHTAALLAEIAGMEQRAVPGRVQRDLIGRARAAAQGWLGRLSSPARTDAQVIVCASGNLANVYFKDSAAKIPLDTLNAHYPGLVDALTAHPGVGVVIAYADNGAPVALGRVGARNLRTGAVTGSDPLVMYGDPDLRAAQLLRLAEFPHAGDLVVNSTLYPDGQVAAFEELVGSHGGLGGPQTEAVLLHPTDMTIPATSNATDVFALLNARRGLPGEPLQPRSAVPQADAWSPQTLWAGARNVRAWAPLALRALRLDRAVFRQVAEDPLATGPALLIVLVMLALRGLAFGLDPDIPGPLPVQVLAYVLGGFGAWLLMVLLAQAAGRLLHGKGDFTRTLRALAFAETPQLIGLLQLAPVVGPLFLIVSTVMSLLAAWIALQQALELRGLVAALIPFVGLAVLVAAVLIGALMVGGATLTAQIMLMHLGLSPGQ